MSTSGTDELVKKFIEKNKLQESLNEAELSKLQKEYQDYFKDTLKEFEVDSPARLSAEKKIEFFKAIKSGWEIGKGKK